MRKLIAVIAFFALPGIALAQGNRAQSWEWSIGTLYQESKAMGSEGGSTLDVDDAFGLALNIGYNFTDNLSLGLDFDWIEPDYKAVLIDDTVVPADSTVIDHKFTQFNWRVKGTYSFLDGPFRPFIEGGVGWTFVDSNVADGPPIVGCWWHPWWGYICDGFYNTFSDDTFTYGLGLGARYYFPGGTFLKAGYSVWELDDVGKAGDSSLSGIRLEFGWDF